MGDQRVWWRVVAITRVIGHFFRELAAARGMTSEDAALRNVAVWKDIWQASTIFSNCLCSSSGQLSQVCLAGSAEIVSTGRSRHSCWISATTGSKSFLDST